MSWVDAAFKRCEINGQIPTPSNLLRAAGKPALGYAGGGLNLSGTEYARRIELMKESGYRKHKKTGRWTKNERHKR